MASISLDRAPTEPPTGSLDQIELFATEWLEIKRTLAANTTRINEMNLDLKRKKMIIERCSQQLGLLDQIGQTSEGSSCGYASGSDTSFQSSSDTSSNSSSSTCSSSSLACTWQPGAANEEWRSEALIGRHQTFHGTECLSNARPWPVRRHHSLAAERVSSTSSFGRTVAQENSQRRGGILAKRGTSGERIDSNQRWLRPRVMKLASHKATSKLSSAQDSADSSRSIISKPVREQAVAWQTETALVAPLSSPNEAFLRQIDASGSSVAPTSDAHPSYHVASLAPALPRREYSMLTSSERKGIMATTGAAKSLVRDVCQTSLIGDAGRESVTTRTGASCEWAQLETPQLPVTSSPASALVGASSALPESTTNRFGSSSQAQSTNTSHRTAHFSPEVPTTQVEPRQRYCEQNRHEAQTKCSGPRYATCRSTHSLSTPPNQLSGKPEYSRVLGTEPRPTRSTSSQAECTASCCITVSSTLSGPRQGKRGLGLKNVIRNSLTALRYHELSPPHPPDHSSPFLISVQLRALTQLLLMTHGLKSELVVLDKLDNCTCNRHVLDWPFSAGPPLIKSSAGLSQHPPITAAMEPLSGPVPEKGPTNASETESTTSSVATKPKTLGIFRTGNSRSVSLNIGNVSAKPSSPTVTRSSSSVGANSTTPGEHLPTDYLAHHRPSVPNCTDSHDHHTSGQAGLSRTSPSTLPTTSTTTTLTRPNSFGRYTTYRKKLRGPYGEILESKMRNSKPYIGENLPELGYELLPPPFDEGLSLSSPGKTPLSPGISFTEELLRQTKLKRDEAEQNSKEAIGTNQTNSIEQTSPGSATLPIVKPEISIAGPENENDSGESGKASPCKTGTTLESKPPTAKIEPKHSITALIGNHLDTRQHIIGELYDTEKSYCDMLKTLFESHLVRYVKHASDEPVALPSEGKYLENVAQLMPTVLDVHSKFLEQLRRRIANWSSDQTKIGDLFESFDSAPIVRFYLAMVEHMNEIKETLKAQAASEAKSNKASGQGKSEIRPSHFSLDSLLISIIQRIPRYELLLKRLVKNTKPDHIDFESLGQAMNKIHELLVGIGTNQQNGQSGLETPAREGFAEWDGNAATRQLYVRDLETAIEGAQAVLEQYRPNALVHFFDYVQLRKRDRAVFVLDSNIIICQSKNKKRSDKFEYNKFKLQQVINLENVELRCQCWQHYRGSGTHSATGSVSGSSTVSNEVSLVLSSTGASPCRTCIENLEQDIRYILKMQKKSQRINTTQIRTLIETTLAEQLQCVVRQLAEINETLSRCAKDCNVDLYLLGESERGESLAVCYDLMASATGTTASTGALGGQQETKFRPTHHKCAQHQTRVSTGEPELSIAFQSFKKREDFETVVTGLRARIVKSRFKLEFISHIPYHKARAGLQFTCAIPAFETNNIWICKSDGFVGQISVLAVDQFSEPTVVSCNGVCNAQIVCLKAVPPVPVLPPGVSEYLATTVSTKRNSLYKEALDETDGSENETERRGTEGAASSPSKSNYLLQHWKSSKSNSQKQASKMASPNATHSPTAHSSPQSTRLLSQLWSGNKPAPATTPTTPIAPQVTPSPSEPSSPSHQPVALISPDSPTMWFGTDDSTIYIYSSNDAVRIGKNKAKVSLSAKVEAIEYYKDRVLVGLANHTVAVFTRDSQGFWQTTPTIVEGAHCYRFCVVNQDVLWTTSLNIIQIRNEELKPIEEPIVVKEIDKISFIVANQSVYIASQNSSYIYRYSSTPPYKFINQIAIGPSVDKALAISEDIIRHHKNACLKICTLHVVRDRILVGTSAGVILVLDNKNTLEIIPNGHTGHVRFITSTKMKDGRIMVVAGGDGFEQFSPGAGATLNGPSDLFHFVSYCSNLALNLLGRTSNSAVQPVPNATSTSLAGNGTNPGTVSTTSHKLPATGSTESESPAELSMDATKTAALSTFQSGSEDSKSHLLVWRVI